MPRRSVHPSLCRPFRSDGLNALSAVFHLLLDRQSENDKHIFDDGDINNFNKKFPRSERGFQARFTLSLDFSYCNRDGQQLPFPRMLTLTKLTKTISTTKTKNPRVCIDPEEIYQHLT